MRKKILLPGDRIGSIDEFEVGKGVYEENREIFAQIVGYLEIRDGKVSKRWE
ncbi:MAG: hypothetical protein QXR27_02140 [Archaeoglobaceae archaeon]